MRALCLSLIGLFLLSGEAAARKVALVIGNGAYHHVEALANPSRDARTVAQALLGAGFDDVQVRTDLDRAGMERALVDFATAADGADTALIYVAGHGVESGGRNWLIPVDARIARESDIAATAVGMEAMVAALDRAKSLRVLVLDSCRNNRLRDGWEAAERAAGAQRLVVRGLAGVEIRDALVVYAAKAGTAALDDAGGANSPFAAALAKRLVEPGLEIRRLFGAVRDDVLAATGGQQEPFTYGTLSGAGYYLVPADSASTLADADEQAWRAAAAKDTATAYEEYLRLHRRGRMWAEAALRRSERLDTEARRGPLAYTRRTIRLTPGGGEYGSLQMALWHARDGDRIVLAPGFYTLDGSAHIDKSVAIIGPDAREGAAVLTAPSNLAALSMKAGSAWIEGVTIRCHCTPLFVSGGGVTLRGVALESQGAGGPALSIGQDARVAVFDSALRGGAGYAAVSVTSGSLVVRGSRVETAPPASGTGPGVFFFSGTGDAVVARSTIVASRGGVAGVTGLNGAVFADNSIDLGDVAFGKVAWSPIPMSGNIFSLVGDGQRLVVRDNRFERAPLATLGRMLLCSAPRCPVEESGNRITTR